MAHLLVTWSEVARYREYVEIPMGYDEALPFEEQDGAVQDAVWSEVSAARGRAKPLDPRDGDEEIVKVEALG